MARLKHFFYVESILTDRKTQADQYSDGKLQFMNQIFLKAILISNIGQMISVPPICRIQ